MLLSIIVPCYNEEKTLGDLLDRLLDLNVKGGKEIIIVNDGSTDNSGQIITSYDNKFTEIIVIENKTNLGKTAAIRKAQDFVTGKYVVIQDADLEYSPVDILELLDKAESSNFAVVYGSRNLGQLEYRYPHYYLGGVFLTKLYNFLYNDVLTDISTCYKLFLADIFNGIKLETDGFEFCVEVTCKLRKQNITIVEHPISYTPRTFAEGKKIRTSDGLKAVYTILKNKLNL